MTLAVKNTPDTAAPSGFDRLPVAVLAGVVYVLGSLAIIFKGLPTAWSMLQWPGIVSAVVLGLLMLAAASALTVLGLRLLGPQPPRGLKTGIVVGLVGAGI